VSKQMVVVAGIAKRAGRVLVARRRGGSHDGKWEFPGGKVERGESCAAALAREFAEEFGVAARVGRRAGTVEICSPRARMLIVFHEVRFEGKPGRREHSSVLWALPRQLAAMDMLGPDALIAAILSWKRRSGRRRGPRSGHAGRP